MQHIQPLDLWEKIVAWAAAIVVAAVAALVIWVLWPTAANAQDQDTRWAQRRFCAQYAWWDNTYCLRYRYERRRYYAQRQHREPQPVRYYAPPRDDDWQSRDPRYERGVECRPEVVRVVGAAALSDDAATRAAVRQWQATVAYDFGQKYMDLQNARGYRWRCDRASANESVVGKVGEMIAGESATQKRCVVIARPCMMPMKEGDKDKD